MYNSDYNDAGVVGHVKSGDCTHMRYRHQELDRMPDLAPVADGASPVRLTTFFGMES